MPQKFVNMCQHAHLHNNTICQHAPDLSTCCQPHVDTHNALIHKTLGGVLDTFVNVST